LGQKVHPIGFRIGVIRNPDSTWYLPKRQFAGALYEDYQIRRAIKKDEFQKWVKKGDEKDAPRLSQAAISRMTIKSIAA